jgi:hypothetical protein
MMNYAVSPRVQAQAELELRRRQHAHQLRLRALALPDFAARTQIEVPNDMGTEVAHMPFTVWPAQCGVLDHMMRERLVAFLKARQIGVSWLACLFAMRNCSLYPGYPVLCLSRSQDDADKMIHRISFLYHQHQDKQWLSRLTRDNMGTLEWANGSSVVSLAATKNAGRGFTGALAILDEWAFMAWPRQTLTAVKPTIDAGGKLFIISSADGQGSAYHQFWQHAETGRNGYTPVFLPWFTHPDRGPDWREQKIIEASGDTASVLREYPANAIEAFTAAAGLVYDVWSDGPEDGNVTDEADYREGAGSVYWGVDDGYSGAFDPTTGYFTPNSAPRVFLLLQELADGSLNVFAEHYAFKTMEETDIAAVLAMKPADEDAKPYPPPVYAAVDSASAALRGRLQLQNIYTRGKPQHIDESVKATRRMLAKDTNGRRRIRVHPRCKYLRREMASYRNDDQGNPIDDVNHGPDALRYIAWTKRNDQ